MMGSQPIHCVNVTVNIDTMLRRYMQTDHLETEMHNIQAPSQSFGT